MVILSKLSECGYIVNYACGFIVKTECMWLYCLNCVNVVILSKLSEYIVLTE